MVFSSLRGNDNRGWFGRIEVEHDVQSQGTDLGEQVSGQNTASLTAFAAESEKQLQDAVDGQAGQLLATPVKKFD
ncbi:hypothetical protein OG199_02620 [Streptomyces sp. NBC_01176]|nr:hypothetical protein OG199_02620 [Streptomyces sp. NBC_01176]